MPVSRFGRVLRAVFACFLLSASLLEWPMPHDAQTRSRARGNTAPRRAKRAAPARNAVRQQLNADGSITGQPWTGEAGFRETTASLVARQRQRDLLRPRRQREREPDEEHVPINRENLPRNPDALPGAQWPPLEKWGPGEGGTRGQDKAPVSRSPTPLVSLSPTLSFTAATLADTTAYPPDTMGAVGPSQFLAALNGRIRVFDKTTGEKGALDVDSDVFFDSVRGGEITTDPRVRYDRLSGRWFVLMINVAASNNRIMLAVSDGPTIAGQSGWTFYFFPQNQVAPEGDFGCFADYPSLGIDRHALYVGTNQFCNRTFANTAAFVIRKSSVLGGGPIVVSAFRNLIDGNPLTGANGIFSPTGVDNSEPDAAAPAEGYFIGTEANGFGKLVMRRVSAPGATPVMSPNLYINVLTTSNPITVRHRGNNNGASGRLDPLDDRLFAAQYRRGSIWTAHNIAVDQTGSAEGLRTRNGSRWYEIGGVNTADPQLRQAGTLFDPAANDSFDNLNYWMPSLIVSGQGHALMGFSLAGTNEFVNAGIAVRHAGDQPGTLQAPLKLTNIQAAYNPPGNSGAASGRRRWGDYSYTSLDPCDDMTFWTIQQFCDATNSYGLRVAKIPAPPPATPAGVSPASVPAGLTSATVTVTGLATNGSGFYDPGAAFNCRLRASVSGGVIVKSLNYINPTTIALELSTASATAGLKHVTITNPDGQSVTAENLLTVGDCAYTVAGGNQSFAAGGGTGSLNVTTNNQCGWTAVSQASFITITGGKSGSGDGAVNYNIAQNYGAARTGTLSVAGQTVTIAQEAGNGCDVTLAPASRAFPAAGGSGSFAVAAPGDCAWTATASDPFIQIVLGGQGGGNGTLTFTVAENKGVAARSGFISIFGHRFTITQEAAPHEIAVDDGTFEVPAGLPQGGTSFRVNRLTPSSYPATLNAVAIFFTQAGGARVGDPLTILVGTNADGDGNINNTEFKTLEAQVQTIGGFNVYAVPEITITQGDFLVGMRIAHNEGVLPVPFDSTPPSRARSYRSLDGKTFTLTEDLGSPGNYGIRARLVRPSRLIVATGSALAEENCPPKNDAIDPGETVTVNLSLRNDGVNPSTDLTATLETGASVIAPGQTQSYGAIAPGAAAVTRPFTFTASGVCGSTITVRLILRDGETDLGTVAFKFTLGAPAATGRTFSYTGGPVAIPDGDTRGTSIPLVVSGMATSIADLNFRFEGTRCSSEQGLATAGVDHSWIGDLVFKLTSPAGTSVTIVNRAGGAGNGGNNFCQTLLDDDAANALSIGAVSTSSAPYSGTFRPSNPLSAFDGENPNGTWTLQAIDDSPGDSGSVRAFSLAITGFACCARADQGYEADVAPRGTGGGGVTATDWVQIGRFIAGLESPAAGSEFQRADCAPRATLGDGKIDLADWAQAGRYISGVDALLPTGGPSNPAPVASAREAAREFAARFRLEAVTGSTVRISLDSPGNEDAAAFSLNFDPSQWRFVGAKTARGGTLIVNSLHAAEGRLGFVLTWKHSLPWVRSRPPHLLPSGSGELLWVRFAPVGARNRRAVGVGFGDRPVARQIMATDQSP